MCNGDEAAYTIKEEMWSVGSEWHRCWNGKGDDYRGQGWKFWSLNRKERRGEEEGARAPAPVGVRACARVVIMKPAVSPSVTCCECNHWTSVCSRKRNESEESWIVSTSQWGQCCSLKGILEIRGGVLCCLIVCRAGSSRVRCPMVSTQVCQKKKLPGIFSDFRMTQWALLKDVILKCLISPYLYLSF